MRSISQKEKGPWYRWGGEIEGMGEQWMTLSNPQPTTHLVCLSLHASSDNDSADRQCEEGGDGGKGSARLTHALLSFTFGFIVTRANLYLSNQMIISDHLFLKEGGVIY